MADDPKEFSRTAEELIASLRRLPNENPPGMRKRPTKDLGPLIEEILVKNQIGRDSPEQTIREKWPELVGHANAQYSHPARIERERSLVVLTSHAVVRNELFHHRKLIVEKIQKLPGCAHVREINVRAG
ncbi:MAG: DUF721 domain-containing protein [Nibricoccus sp.]